MQNHENQNWASNANETPLVMPLTALDASMLTLVGGKAANLGELIRAGFPVPPGFCVTTTAYALLNEDTRLESILLELASTGAEATLRLGELALAARSALMRATVPANVVKAITEAYRALCNGDSVPVGHTFLRYC